MVISNKRIGVIMLLGITPLLIPLIAMQFTDEVNWTFFDFSIAALLLMVLGLVIELVRTTVKESFLRGALIVFCGAIFALLWAELAVGIFN